MPDQTLGSQVPVGYADLGGAAIYAEKVELVAAAGAAAQKITAGGAGVGQTLFSYVGKIALSTTLVTTSTLFTVPAGKTAYITDLFLSHDTAQVIDTQLQAGGVPIFRAPVKGDTAPVQMPGMETQPQATTGSAVSLVYPAMAGPPNAFYLVSGYFQ